MASLPCKLIAKVAFKAGGDVFHHLFTNNPQHLAKVSPAKIQACDLHQGNYGTVGSILHWAYTIEGREQIAKKLIEDIDGLRKQFSYRMIEGDLMKLYKNMLFTFHVEAKDGVDFITFTMEYQLLNAENPHPISLLKFVLELIKDIEAHVLG